MRILGVDFGVRKIGLAMAEGFLVEPLVVLKYAAVKTVYQKIASLVHREAIEKIVVGLSEGKMAKMTKKFALGLKKVTHLPIEFQDETLTSQEALAKMKKRDKRVKDEDAISAALILQSYLEKKKNV